MGDHIRHCEGNVSLSFSGATGFGTTNMAEMEALLHIGIREAHLRHFQHIVVEGDSLCAIRWASRRCSAPWALMDAVEEVRDLSKDVEISFVHVKTSANGTVIFLQRRASGIRLFTSKFFILN